MTLNRMTLMQHKFFDLRYLNDARFLYYLMVELFLAYDAIQSIYTKFKYS